MAADSSRGTITATKAGTGIYCLTVPGARSAVATLSTAAPADFVFQAMPNGLVGCPSSSNIGIQTVKIAGDGTVTDTNGEFSILVN